MEEIIDAANGNLQNQVIFQNEEHVIEMEELTDTDSDVEIHPAAALPIPPVEIVAFPNFNNLQPLMPEEFPPDQLMGFEGGNEPDIQEHIQQNIQIGIIQII